jgi:hypothetical protein
MLSALSLTVYLLIMNPQKTYAPDYLGVALLMAAYFSVRLVVLKPCNCADSWEIATILYRPLSPNVLHK